MSENNKTQAELTDRRPRRWVRIAEVEKIVNLKRTQIYEAIARNEFPRPVKVTGTGSASRWDEDELIDFQEARMAARKRSA